MNVKQCTCDIHPNKVNSKQGAQAATSQQINLHTEYQDSGTSNSQFFQNDTRQRECKVIRVLPNERCTLHRLGTR